MRLVTPAPGGRLVRRRQGDRIRRSGSSSTGSFARMWTP